MNSPHANTRVAFIGLGIMGQSMASHLLNAGYPMNLYNRSPEKMAALAARGARPCDSPAQAAKDAQVVITMVGFPNDVQEVWLGPQGIVQSAKNALLIDMTTSSPELAQKLARAAAEHGHQALDAPVSGGDVGAREAKLSIMVGGEPSAFEQALPLFNCMGANIKLLGPAGSGQHTKMANQLIIASTIIGVCEGLIYARKSGLDPNLVLQTIGGGAAGGAQLNILGPRIVKGDFAPGFFIEHFLKDLGIALSEADRLGLKLPGATLSQSLYEQLAQRGLSRAGTQALFKYFEEAQT
jgi:3-hydroxyisobutyrate dehydrogenase